MTMQVNAVEVAYTKTLTADCSKRLYRLAPLGRGDLPRVARKCALRLLDAAAAERQRDWSPAKKRDWSTAFNALQRLSGHKIRL